MASLDKARLCADCGKPLSRYNTDDRCQACASAVSKAAASALQTREVSHGRVEHREHIGMRIAALRHERGLTQESLAERAGVSLETVRKVEQQRRTPTLDMLNVLADGLGVAPAQLLNPAASLRRDYIPDDVISRPDFAAACYERDIGALFRIAVDEGFTVSHLARQCEMTISHVTSYMRKRRQARSISVIERVSDGLRIPGELLRIGRREWEGESEFAESLGPTPPQGTDVAAPSDAGDSWAFTEVADEEVMRRRAFLLNVAVLASLGAADKPAAVETIRRELNLSYVEQRASSDADEWQQIALEYGESYPVTAPADLMRPLVVDMLGIEEALRRCNNPVAQRDLLRVASLLSAFTAQTITNMGHAHEAMRWWRTSRNMADRSGDPYSAVWVRAREIIRAMETRPTASILSLIETAERLTGPAPSEATLELLAAKAQTLALAGRKEQAEETLSQLREQFSKSRAGYSGSVLAWGQERLHNTESFAYSRLGYLSETEAARTSGLALYDAANVRWPTGIEMNLAFCLVRGGHVNEGLSHAQAVINGLPEAERIKPITDDGRKLLTLVPLRERNTAAVREYREWVNASLGDRHLEVADVNRPELPPS